MLCANLAAFLVAVEHYLGAVFGQAGRIPNIVGPVDSHVSLFAARWATEIIGKAWAIDAAAFVELGAKGVIADGDRADHVRVRSQIYAVATASN